MNYANKSLVGAMIVAGWDPAEGGQVWGCPIGGTLVREGWTTDGSGSTYIWGFLDSEFRRDLFPLPEAALACGDVDFEGSCCGWDRLCMPSLRVCW